MAETEKTLELIKRAQSNDESAKSELVETNSPLIKSVIRRYKNKGVEYDDLYQLGCLGFLKAIKNFSDKFDVKFSTYAVPMIAGEVKRFLRDDGYIKVSRSTKSLAGKISYFIESYSNENSKSPSIEEIAKNFKIESSEVVFALESIKFPLSLYDKTDDENNQSLIDKVACATDTAEDLDKLILKDLINDLTEREKKIIILRYYRDKTQSEVARVLNVSQVQVSRIEAKILGKIKAELSV
ncbi:MAG: SigB/SigF/SigG family RNA polymerase sigma factor [Firmicutes bacterium]|nr:SigB/SigF/SigG family RNA polymerase sigma factor [Bacillota bacterium]MCL2255973.1 SigB/SigF/SigG family RNA polymerase sigma factor [Bacillota bacterium]